MTVNQLSNKYKRANSLYSFQTMNSELVLKILTFLAIFCSITTATSPCIPKDFGESRTVCVCNSTYCDSLDRLEFLSPGTFVIVTSSKDGLRFSSSTPNVIKPYDGGSAADDSALQVTVYSGGKHYQKIIGFGGAFTDATGINLKKHDESLQQIIVDQYFGESGLEYNIARVPMGGADFSDHPYTYAPVEGDVNLDHFALTDEDRDLKIPYIKEAYKRRSDLKLFASVWTAPPWMKTNNDYIGKGSLKPEYYPVWANYFIKFLEEYAKQGLSFWAISTQNEPLHGEFFDMGFNCMGWTAAQQRNWIKTDLGPKLKESEFRDVKVIMYDDQRLHLQNYTEEILRDPEAAQYISGIGVHWYTDSFVPPGILTTTHYNFPDYFLLGTEACAGAMPRPEPDVILGSWERGVNYASDIISDLNNFVGGWIDWNLLLDLEGGPNWAKNFVDAPIISDSSLKVIYKQPIYYALGHFSKFIPENSSRIRHMKSNTSFVGVEILTCVRPDGMVSVVLLNRLNSVQNVTIINDDGEDVLGFMNVELSPSSISTVIYNPGVMEQTTKQAAETSYHWSNSLSGSTAVQISNTLLFILLLSITCNVMTLFH